jgi:hypothetical protein
MVVCGRNLEKLGIYKPPLERAGVQKEISGSSSLVDPQITRNERYRAMKAFW